MRKCPLMKNTVAVTKANMYGDAETTTQISFGQCIEKDCTWWDEEIIYGCVIANLSVLWDIAQKEAVLKLTLSPEKKE